MESVLGSSMVEVDFFLPFLALLDLVVLGIEPVVLGLVPDEVPVDDDDEGAVDGVVGGGAIPLSGADEEPSWVGLVILPSSRSLGMGASVWSETFPSIVFLPENSAAFAAKTVFFDFSSILGWISSVFGCRSVPGCGEVPWVGFVVGFGSIMYSVLDFSSSRVLAHFRCCQGRLGEKRKSIKFVQGPGQFQISGRLLCHETAPMGGHHITVEVGKLVAGRRKKLMHCNDSWAKLRQTER